MTAAPTDRTPDGPAEFDPTAELPGSGTWVLEASAGTGKTYTIAALAARYLAAGVPLQALMMVTFSRAATQELRTRIREKLVETEAGLRGVLEGAPARVDPVVALLCDGGHDELAERLTRITAALSDFDTATIATTHEFCGRMLDGLGVLNDTDPRAVHTDDLSDLVHEAAADLWLRKFAFASEPGFGLKEAIQIAEKVTEVDSDVVPDVDGNADRIAFARAVRRELRVRKALRGLRTHHDLLTGLAALLEGRSPSDPQLEGDPELAAEVASRLAGRFTHVLIDEFQDTDPLQWQIVRRAFVGRSTVVLIGDPKQAIYAFRGADVHAYLEAVSEPGAEHRTLATNWRSDAELMAGLEVILGGAQLGDERIRVRPVRAHHPGSRLSGLPAELAAPVRLRTLPLPEDPRREGPRVDTIRTKIMADLVTDLSTLLGSGASVEVDGISRPVRASDVAILVNSNKTAEAIRLALQTAGIPAVYPGATSVYRTAEADDWRLLLTAFDQPRASTIRRAALTSFLGWTMTDLALADETALNDLSATVRHWSTVLQDQGVAALLETMNSPTSTRAGLSSRLLGEQGGERRLTDLRHLAQALHEARTREQLGTAALLEWLTRRLRETGSESERTRRLDTDAAAVQIMTVHRSKGLQFPIVYLPDQWNRFDPWPREDRGVAKPFVFHGPSEAGDSQQFLFVGRHAPRWQEAYFMNRQEDRAESLRQFYVAATRAQCQVVAWWAWNDSNTPSAPLHRILFRRDDPEPRQEYPSRAHPRELSHLGVPQLSITDIEERPASALAPAAEHATLQVRHLDREWDEQWRRTSYSGLTAAAHELSHLDARSASPVDDDLLSSSDEVELAGDPNAPVAPPELRAASLAPDVETHPGLQQQSPMAGLPRGTSFGTLVHTVYEHFDPAAEDLAAELRRVAAQTLVRLPADGLVADELAEALLPAALTPLGKVSGGLRLCDIPAGDRLAELDFEYPLAGGETPRGRLTLAAVADLLERHLAPDDPLVDYPRRLRDPLLAEQVLRGFLTGSIDAVLRIPQTAGDTRGTSDGPFGGDDHRYLVVDYKTNWLGTFEPGAALTLESYRGTAMAEAMMEAHYPLQALLYAVALHRFLRWRQPGYSPAKHLGGVAYLFVRGMAGEQTPVVDGMPCGVFTWYPSADLVVALSELIDTAGISNTTPDDGAGER